MNIKVHNPIFEEDESDQQKIFSQQKLPEVLSQNSKTTVEVIKNTFYFISDKEQPQTIPNAVYYNSEKFVYKPFYADFGPLNLSSVNQYINDINELLQQVKKSKQVIIHFASTKNEKSRTNAAFLVGSFMIVAMKLSSQFVWDVLLSLSPKLLGYKHASPNENSYQCTVGDCLRGLEYAVQLKWYDHKKFDKHNYDKLESDKFGYVHQIIPNKLWAFKGPQSKEFSIEGHKQLTPQHYVKLFHQLGVKLVVRLNDPEYEEKFFIKNGINHVNLIFPDGSTPKQNIMDQFFQEAEKITDGGIAVHCQAGLGRTGTIIGIYAMKHYKFPAGPFIGWCRIVRPGSIIGAQQPFLHQVMPQLHELSDQSQIYQKIKNMISGSNKIDATPSYVKQILQTPQYKTETVKGDKGQAEGLLKNRSKFQ